jgi:hypothetical protein
MGRKGVSKRKSSKSKNPVVADKGSNGAVSGLSKTSASPVATPLVREESLSSSKGGKKTDKKR